MYYIIKHALNNLKASFILTTYFKCFVNQYILWLYIDLIEKSLLQCWLKKYTTYNFF